MEERIIKIYEDGNVHLPWKIVEIDGKKFEVAVEVATLLQAVSEERDAALDWLRMRGTHGAECVPGYECRCGLTTLIGNPVG